jgi:hypothetical protein
MRALNIAFAVTVVLFGLAGVSNKLVTAASANFEPHDAVIYGLHIALPDGVRTFPAELVPLP